MPRWLPRKDDYIGLINEQGEVIRVWEIKQVVSYEPEPEPRKMIIEIEETEDTATDLPSRYRARRTATRNRRLLRQRTARLQQSTGHV